MWKECQNASSRHKQTRGFTVYTYTSFSFLSEIVLFKPKHLHAKFEEPKEVLSDGSAKTSEIIGFIDEKQVGLVGHMTPPKEAFFKKPQVVVYYNIDWKRDMKVQFSFLFSLTLEPINMNELGLY